MNAKTNFAAALVFGALAVGFRPDPVITVSAWAAESRWVPPEASRYHGRWSNDRTPYLVEVMDELSLSNPCREVVFIKSAQVGATEAGINLFGTIASRTPAPMMILLPTGDSVRKYLRTKLEPAIDATPELRRLVETQKSRDEKGSTSTFKRFPGGFAIITGANSSSDLQMVSVRVVILEEVSEYPFDVDKRGDPVSLAIARTKSYSDVRKVFYNSTPAIKGSCRVTAKYAESDQRRYYVPCPHCGAYQILEWKNLRWDSETPPHGAHFVCAGSGCVIEPHHLQSMVAKGAWLKTFEGDDKPGPVVDPADLGRHRGRSSQGRIPGFFIWQAYSPFVPWDDTVTEYLKSRGNPFNTKVFTQQALGEAFEEKGEAPDHERLYERREKFPARRLVPGVLFLTAATDVQGNRLEWTVYGWGRDLSSWVVDHGIITGDPNLDDVWTEHDKVLSRTYDDAWGRPVKVDAWGIDTGYLGNRVYRYCHRHGGESVYALDGRHGWGLLPLGAAKAVDVDHEGRRIGVVKLWPVGTWGMKSEVYTSLRQTIAGPDDSGVWPAGAMHLNQTCDREFCEQLTAEYLHDKPTNSGLVVKEWRKARARNEQLDLAVYARSLAHHLSDSLTAAQWDDLVSDRLGRPQDMQLDLAAYWSGGLVPPAPPPAESPAPPAASAAEEPRRPADSGWLKDVGDNWLRRN